MFSVFEIQVLFFAFFLFDLRGEDLIFQGQRREQLWAMKVTRREEENDEVEGREEENQKKKKKKIKKLT